MANTDARNARFISLSRRPHAIEFRVSVGYEFTEALASSAGRDSFSILCIASFSIFPRNEDASDKLLGEGNQSRPYIFRSQAQRTSLFFSARLQLSQIGAKSP